MKSPVPRCSVALTVLAIASLALGGCAATWSSSEVTNVRPDEVSPAARKTSEIVITEGDITDRQYAVLGDLSVTVNKTTLFHADPTRDQVNDKLREEAAKIGADAVIHVRYGTVGMSMLSYGSLNGKGRAVKLAR